jgi:hypothetical protein
MLIRLLARQQDLDSGMNPIDIQRDAANGFGVQPAVIHQTHQIEWSACEEQLFDASPARIRDSVREHKRVGKVLEKARVKAASCVQRVYMGIYIRYVDFLIRLTSMLSRALRNETGYPSTPGQRRLLSGL